MNKDTAFFEVSSPDINLNETDMSKDLISLSISERLGSMPQGSLQFHDKNHVYSRILRTGAELKILWGYKGFDFQKGIVDNNLQLDEITGDIVRRGYAGFVTSPNGAGGANGIMTYNCNFTAYGMRGTDNRENYTSGTKRDVIIQAFTDIGILPQNMIINFTQGNDRLDENKTVVQDETTYAFLVRIAKEWRTLFTINFNQQGLPVGIFVDPDKVASPDILLRTFGATGTNHYLGWKGKLNNVISYTWSSNESENGIGDNIQIELVDGQPVFRRYVAEQETVVTYTLNTERLRAEFKDREIDGFVAQTKLARELLSAQTFDQVKRFFDPYETTTAPQGFGYRVKLNMIGNPLFSPPNIVNFYNGFPDRLGNRQTIYYINEVTHTINRSGYNMSVEVVDAFTFSDIGVAII